MGDGTGRENAGSTGTAAAPTHNWGRTRDDAIEARAWGRRGPDRPDPAAAVTVRGSHRNYTDAAHAVTGTVVTAAGDHLELLDGGIVRAGAGATLETLQRFARQHGLHVPVLPGTLQVSVGGAIAGDVHGKNHTIAGSFHTLVSGLRLRTFAGELLDVDDKHPLYPVIVGGMGLCGIIEEADLRLPAGVVTAFALEIDAHARPDDTLADLRRRADLGHVYARICPRTARTVVLAATEAHTGVPVPAPRRPLSLPRTGPALTGRTMRRLETFQLRHLARSAGTVSVVDACTYLAPLDRFDGWNLHVGRHGFRQYQYAIPDGHEDVVLGVLASAQREGGYFITFRRLGSHSPGWLSFPIPGWAVSFDHDNPPTGLAKRLDREVARIGGRCNLGKNLDTRRETLEVMYPELCEMRRTVLQLGGPRPGSGLACRLGIST